MNKPKWIIPTGETGNNRAFTDMQIWALLGDNPAVEWNILSTFNAETDTLSDLVNLSMAVALQCISLSVDDDGFFLYNQTAGDGALVKWKTISSSLQENLTMIDEENSANFVAFLRKMADKIEASRA